VFATFPIDRAAYVWWFAFNIFFNFKENFCRQKVF